MIWIKTRACRKGKNLFLCLFLKISLSHLWCVCTEDSQQEPACCCADITSFQMCFMHLVQCPTIIHCYQIFLFFSEGVMGLANTVFLCWLVEYTVLNEVTPLEVVYYCSVFCITVAPLEQIRFLLCKVIHKYAAGDISHLSIHIYLQVIEEIKLTWKWESWLKTQKSFDLKK